MYLSKSDKVIVQNWQIFLSKFLNILLQFENVLVQREGGIGEGGR